MAAPLRIIVLGAGVESLACACELAIQGAAVTIVQPQQSRSEVVRLGSFSFDLRETMITRPHSLRELFSRAGRAIDDYLALVEVDPFIRLWFSDGVMINVRRDAGLFARQLDQQFPLDRQGANYCKFVLSRREKEPASSQLFELLKPITEPHVAALCNELLTLCSMQAVDEGMSYTLGGVRQVGFALERLAAELGVDFVFGQPVPRAGTGTRADISIDGKATPADAIIDCAQSGSSKLVLLLGLNRPYPHLALHNIFRGSGATLTVNAPCTLDPAQAPPGSATMRVEMDHAGDVNQLRSHAFAVLRKCGMDDLEKRIVIERLIEPLKIERDAGLAAIRGIAAAQRAIAANRVGAST